MAKGLFGGGKGTTEKPFLIKDESDLEAIRSVVDYGYDNDDGTDIPNFLQTHHITLKSPDFIPLYTNDSGDTFKGHYDGGGFTIKGLQSFTAVGSWKDQGFFGSISNASLINIHIQDAIVKNGDIEARTGILAGTAYNSVIEDCSVSGVMEVQARGNSGYTSGGLVGKVSNLTVKRCSAVNLKVASRSFGGLLGSGYGIEVEDCYTDGLVNMQMYSDMDKDNYLPGEVAGLFTSGDGSFKNCYTNLLATNTDKLIDTVFTFPGSPPSYLCSGSAPFFSQHVRPSDVAYQNSYYDIDRTVTSDSWKQATNYRAEYSKVRGSDGNLYYCSNPQQGYIYDSRGNLILNPDGGPVSGSRWYLYWDPVSEISHPGGRSTSDMHSVENYVGWDFDEVWKWNEDALPTLRKRKTKRKTKCERIAINNILGGRSK